MLKQEFESRVKMSVSAEEYSAIELVYLKSDLEKDDFCKMWSKMNAKRIKSYREAEKAKREKHELLHALFSIVNILRDYGHTIGFSSSSENVLTTKMRATLDKAGISVMDFSYIDFQPRYKDISALHYDIQEYINKAV